jgi:LPS sulfotransferase NodH
MMCGYIGGAGGEHFVRTRLQDELVKLGCTLTIADSDAAMEAAVRDATRTAGGMGGVYRWIIMDQWTAISPQLQLRSWLNGIEDRLRITAFFGQVFHISL